MSQPEVVLKADEVVLGLSKANHGYMCRLVMLLGDPDTHIGTTARYFE
jgi:hypothetical protein